MNFIILADKYNKGSKSKGCSGLILKNNKTMIKQQTSAILSAFPQAKILYIYGYDQKRINNYISLNYKNKKEKLRLIHNPNYATNGFGCSLLSAKNYFNESAVIMFGNTVVTKSMLQKIKDKVPQVFLSKTTETKLGCVITDGFVENLSYGLTNYVYGIYHLPKQEMSMIDGILDTKIAKNMFIFEIINLLIDKKIQFEPCFIRKQTKE